jgi:hypothetical protein
MLGNLREIFSSGIMRRLAYLLVRKKLTAIRERLDPAEYGGAPLLGVNGVAIIAHGSSNARAIRNAIRAAANEALVRHVNSDIIEILAAHSPETMIAKPSGRGIRGLFVRMRDRLHLHREANPERKIERFSKSEKSDKSERHERAESFDASHAAGPAGTAIGTTASPDEEGHADGAAASHLHSSAAVPPSHNGNVADARHAGAESHEGDGAGDRREGEGQSQPGHPPKGETS